jgi:hypothetical protein
MLGIEVMRYRVGHATSITRNARISVVPRLRSTSYLPRILVLLMRAENDGSTSSISSQIHPMTSRMSLE